MKVMVLKMMMIYMTTLVRILMTASSSGLAWIRSVTTVRDKFPMSSIFTPDGDGDGDGDVDGDGNGEDGDA